MSTVESAALELFVGYVLAQGTKVIIATGKEGTEEIPVHLLHLVKLLLEQERNVVVAVDLPDMNELHEYGEGRLTETSLLALPFWREVRDGRSSRAIFKLLSELRELKRSGALTILTLGDQPSEAVFEQRLSETIARHTDPNSDTILLAFVQSEQWKPPHTIVGGGVKIASIEIKPTWGAAWYCNRFGCGARPLSWYNPGRGEGLLEKAIASEVASFTLWIGPSSPSYPIAMY